MNNEQLLLALKKMLIIVENLDSRVNELKVEESPVSKEISQLRWFINHLEKMTKRVWKNPLL